MTSCWTDDCRRRHSNHSFAMSPLLLVSSSWGVHGTASGVRGKASGVLATERERRAAATAVKSQVRVLLSSVASCKFTAQSDWDRKCGRCSFYVHMSPSVQLCRRTEIKTETGLLTLARGRLPAARAAHPPPSRRIAGTITRTRTGALDVSDAELPGTWWGWLTGC